MLPLLGGCFLTSMIIDSLIRFSREEWESFPPNVRQHVMSSLTYTNPKYEQNARLGFSNFATPRDLYTFSREDGRDAVSCMRGEIRKVFHALTGVMNPELLEINDKTVSVPTNIEYMNTSFDLDERQVRCVEACLETSQGIIHAATSAGKSAMIMKLIAERKEKTLIVVNRSVLMNQLVDDAKKWLPNAVIGTIAAGKCAIGDVTFAIEKTLLNYLDEVKDQFGMVIMDEVHVCPALSFQRILNKVPARYRYGFTGTVKRKDRMEFYMYAAFGGIIATVTKDELEAADRTTPIQVRVHDTRASVPPEVFDLDTVKKHRAIEDALHSDPSRHMDVAGVIDLIFHEWRDKGGDAPRPKIVVACRYLAPLDALGELLTHQRPELRIRFVTGQEKDQNESCQMLERGECDVILATIGCFSTGVNIPSLTDLILMSPIFSNELLVHQLRGRLMRKSEGKEVGTFHFMWDENVFEHKKLIQFLRLVKR